MSTRRTYGRLLDAALRATLLALAAKVFSVIILANLEGAAVELRTFLTVVPYLSVRAAPEVFLNISTYSTLFMALAAALYLTPSLLRADTPSQRTWGRAMGVVIAAETLTLQVIIHYVGWANIRPDRVWWIVMVLGAGLLLAAGGLGFDLRSPLADPVSVRREEHEPRPHLPAAA